MLSLTASWLLALLLMAGMVMAAMVIVARLARGLSRDSEQPRREAARLETLIVQARVEADRLEAALARLEGCHATAANGLDFCEPLFVESPAHESPAHESSANESSANEPSANGQQVHSVEALPRLATSLASDTPRADPFAGNRQWLQMAELADRGQSAAEIARRLQKPVGEVELLLSLR